MKNSKYTIPSTIDEEIRKILGMNLLALISYFWVNYKRKFSIKNYLIAIILGIINIIVIVTSIIFSIFNPEGWKFLLYSLVSGVIISIFLIAARISDFQCVFNVKNIYIVISIVFGGGNLIYAIIFSNIVPLDSFIGLFSSLSITLFLIYLFSKRISRAGIIRFFGLIMYADINKQKFWVAHKTGTIRSFLNEWDGWIAELLQLRIKNYNELQTNLFNKIVSNPLSIQQALKQMLNQDFFDKLKNWKNTDNLAFISKKIIDLIGKKPDFIPDSKMIRFKRNYDMIEIISIFFSIIIGIISLMISIIGFLVP